MIWNLYKHNAGVTVGLYLVESIGTEFLVFRGEKAIPDRVCHLVQGGQLGGQCNEYSNWVMVMLNLREVVVFHG